MRALTIATLLGLVLLAPPPAEAGRVNVIAREVATDDWRLNYTSEFDLESINVVVGGPVLNLAITNPFIAVQFSQGCDRVVCGVFAVSLSRGLLPDPIPATSVESELGIFQGIVTGLSEDVAVGGTIFLDGGAPFDDFSLIVAPLPEPSTIVLLVGAVCAGAIRSKRK